MRGVLVVNLGTPASPHRRDVKPYLREFLSDPRVVDLPRWLWLPLLNGVIIPFRSRRSAEAYGKIWTPEGSPLLVNSQRIVDALATELGDGVTVALAMRYGTPSVSHGLDALRAAGADEVTVLPLYPQFSFTTTETVYDAVTAALRRLSWSPVVRRIEDYHEEPAWLAAVAGAVQRFQSVHGRPDRLLFSLHGIPERYARAGDPYARQCEASVTGIAEVLGLESGEYQMCFQSRFGREPWLQPYTDVTLEAWAESGVGYVQVICPGFAADCIETLEEIDMENRALFLGNGGERFEYIPCLNDDPAHVAALAEVVRRQWDQA